MFHPLPFDDTSDYPLCAIISQEMPAAQELRGPSSMFGTAFRLPDFADPKVGAFPQQQITGSGSGVIAGSSLEQWGSGMGDNGSWGHENGPTQSSNAAARFGDEQRRPSYDGTTQSSTLQQGQVSYRCA